MRQSGWSGDQPSQLLTALLCLAMRSTRPGSPTGPRLSPSQGRCLMPGLGLPWCPPAALLLAGVVEWTLAARSCPEVLPWGHPDPREPSALWHLDSGSQSFLKVFSHLSWVLLPRESAIKSLFGTYGREMSGRLRMGKRSSAPLSVCGCRSPSVSPSGCKETRETKTNAKLLQSPKPASLCFNSL